MRYDHYLARGYPIASGVIEGVAVHSVKLALHDFSGFVMKGEWMMLSN
jgi:hypothetical protein